MMKPFPGQLKKSTSTPNLYVFTDEQMEWLREIYPVTENARIMEAMGVSYPTLCRIVGKMGLRKSEEGLKAIYERKGRKHKRMNKYALMLLLSGQETDKCKNIRIQPYTPNQALRRHRSVSKYGYCLDSDCSDGKAGRYVIYYDRQPSGAGRLSATVSPTGL